LIVFNVIQKWFFFCERIDFFYEGAFFFGKRSNSLLLLFMSDSSLKELICPKSLNPFKNLPLPKQEY